jgi:hypothetical protein
MPRSWLSLVRACCPSAAVAVTAWLLVAVPSSAQPQLASQGPSRDRPPASAGLWISASEMAMLPAEGPAWEHLLAQAAQPCGEPDLGDQNDQTNVCVMAKALVATRTGNAVLRGAVLEALARIADGTPYRGRALALGRELAAYVIAADVIDLQHVHAALDHKLRAADDADDPGSRQSRGMSREATEQLGHALRRLACGGCRLPARRGRTTASRRRVQGLSRRARGLRRFLLRRPLLAVRSRATGWHQPGRLPQGPQIRGRRTS